MVDTAAVVLAAGRGTRMRSQHPKVLHPIAGRPLIWHVLAALRAAELPRIVVVVGHRAADVRAAIGKVVGFAEQDEQLGTGHAVAQALPQLDGVGDVVICSGDMPLLQAATFRHLVEKHRAAGATMTLVATQLDNPTGYGRVIFDPAGNVREIVEEAAATPEQKAIRLTNSSVYCINVDWLRSALPRIPLSAKGEYYLTDLAAIAVADGAQVVATAGDPSEMVGINDRTELASVSARLRQRILLQHMLAGVTIVDPAATYVDADVTIAADTVIEPNVHLIGRTVVAADCVIGPNTYIADSEIDVGSRIWASVVESAKVGRAAHIGPFSHLRSGAVIGDGCRIGNYAEIKNSRIGTGADMHHFSYLGDATVGAEVNIGAGTVTCNFDSETGGKSRTVIGDGASIGCDTMLVAPVEVGPRAMTGAGSVVTRDVPSDVLAVGVPARVVRSRRPMDDSPDTSQGATQ